MLVELLLLLTKELARALLRTSAANAKWWQPIKHQQRTICSRTLQNVITVNYLLWVWNWSSNSSSYDNPSRDR
jgi:hypothetical protein